MPSLPRKSTKTQFNKLVKSSKNGKIDKWLNNFNGKKMITTFEKFITETFTNDISIGIDIDGTINDFRSGYNTLYKKYFPNYEIVDSNDWNWYKNMNYDGVDPDTWLKLKKEEIFSISKPYNGAINTLSNIYNFVNAYGYKLNIVTHQPTIESKSAAKKWLDKFGFKYDDFVCVDYSKDKWKYVDILVDDSSDVIGSKPLSKVSIKIEHPYNSDVDGNFNIPSIENLTIDLVKNAISKLKNKTTF